MQLKLYSVRDSKGEVYSPPFLAKTPGEAERSFHGLVKDPKTQVGQYPEDYDLYQIGTFDDVAGKIVGLDTPQHIVKAVNLLSQ